MLLEPSYGKRPMNLLATPVFIMLCLLDVFTLLSLHHYIMTFFVPCYHFALRFIFLGISMTISAFFYLSFSWNIIFSSFILSLYVFLELKQVSWRHHAVQSWFLIHPTTLCLLIWWVQSIYISDDCWYVRTYYCEFIFCLLTVSYLHCLFFLVLLSF